ncbi:MAG TPA: AMP-binding protein [Candidatus Limnocylindrales bacterium]|nr:AMP-binding protein [Candidatus Limnocylindrales bacterium]
MTGIEEKRPWLKSYTLGPFKLARTLEPYPEVPLFSILDRTAEKYPGATAVDYFGKRMSYQDLKLSADSLACALVKLGVKKGDKVASILPTCPQYIIGNFAILKTGAVHVPCSILHKEPELEYEIGESGAETVICLEEHYDRLLKVKQKTKLKHIVVTSLLDYGPAEMESPVRISGVYQFRGLIAEHEPDPPQVEINPREDLAYLAFTGGATGVPKGVMLTHYNRYVNIMQGMPWAMSSLEKSIRGKASACIAVPLFHSYGDSCALFGVYWGLRMILIQDPRDIDYILKVLIENRPFMAALVPTQLMKLRDKELPRMQIQIISGASYLPVDVRESISEKIKMPISEGYGLTETGPMTHLDLTGFSKITGIAAKQKYSIGLPIPDTDVKLIDEESGLECQPGEPGHMYIKGPQVMKGYWPQAGNGLIDGWLPTGDICKMDEDGYFYIVDRIKDMANVSGYKVYTSAVDEVLHQHPAVSMAVAIGIPDPEREGSERIKAFVVLKEEYQDQVSADQIIDFCKEKCASYAVPRYVEFRKSLPLTVTEKIFKRQLREEEIAKMQK